MTNNSTNLDEKEVQLQDFIKKESIVVDLKAGTKEEVIAQLVHVMYENNADLKAVNSEADICKAVIERESMQATAMGKSVAFPHARITGLKDFYLGIGICSEGVDFAAVDRKPVHIVCLMLSPSDQTYVILKVMAALSRFFYNEPRREKFIASETVLDVLSVFEEGDIKISSHIFAVDIMRSVKAYVTLEDKLSATAHKMHLNHLDVLPVVDEDMCLLGVISCLDIFRFGIPEFFSQLKTVSFVKHIDPFEKYFQKEDDALVSEVYKSGNSYAISSDATLMEIIFEMTTNNCPKLFVVEDGVLKGVIDRFNIIDKILMS